MATLKYSRQRESIREFVKASKEHPTADDVYASIRKEYPNISLGTVYRNLSLLVELDEIVKVRQETDRIALMEMQNRIVISSVPDAIIFLILKMSI